MKTLIAFAASLAVNVAILSALEWSAFQAQTPPAGEVTITEAADETDLLAYTNGRAAQALL
jgi:hypothetical protein